MFAAVIQPLLYLVFCLAVTVLAVEDHRWNQLPDRIVVPLTVSGITINCFNLIVPFNSAILGLVTGFFSIQVLRIWQTKRYGTAGIGFGDAKFLGALGAWLGHRSIPFLLVGASVLMLTVYLRREEKPFGVGLGLTAAGIYGTQLIK